MDRERFYRRLEEINEVPTLPAVAMNINTLLEDENTSIRDITGTIEKDQAIVAKILKLVNSPFYGFHSKIDSISRAVVVLGFDTVRNAVMSVSVVDAIKGKGNDDIFDMGKFWRHGVSVAVIARYIASRTLVEAPDRCFVAGLLHDIGKIILAQFFAAEFNAVIELVNTEEIELHRAEKQIFETDHAEVGGYLAGKWHLPEALVDAVTLHHEPAKVKGDPNLVMVVNAANSISHEVQGTSTAGSRMDPQAFLTFRREIEEIRAQHTEVLREIEKACEMLLKR